MIRTYLIILCFLNISYVIILVDKGGIGINSKLELCEDTLESKAFNFSRTKYIDCKLSNTGNRNENIILNGHEIRKSVPFRCLGSIILKFKDIKGNVAHRFKAL